MKNLLRILAALLLVSVLSISCSDDDDNTVDAVDQLIGTWEIVSSATSDCDDSANNETETSCEETDDCGTVTFDGSKFIQIVELDTFELNYTKINANTIEICFVDCVQGTVEIDGDLMTLTSEKDEEDGCISISKFRKI